MQWGRMRSCKNPAHDRVEPKLTQHIIPYSICAHNLNSVVGGGRMSHAFSYEWLQQYLLPRDSNQLDITRNVFCYVDHVDSIGLLKYPASQFAHAMLPLSEIIPQLSVSMLRKFAKIHDCSISSHANRKMLLDIILSHSCPKCHTHITVFSIESSKKEKTNIRVKRFKAKQHNEVQGKIDNKSISFPPQPLDDNLGHSIVEEACKRMAFDKIEEAGCAVCGELKLKTSLSPLKNIKNHLHILKAHGVTCLARTSAGKVQKEYTGPVLDYNCNLVCETCRSSIRRDKVPRLALANGLWLGDVPNELAGLTLVEKMLVARVRHTCCYIKIATGGRKMKANVVAFETPMPRIYSHLPPPRADMDDVLAIFFTGPCKPTAEDYKRSLVLVRRNAVAEALEWLKLNHKDYSDIEISHKNLAEYPENEPPCSVEYKALDTNKTAEGTSVHDMEEEDGVEDGDCAFTVHGLTGEKLDIMSTSKIKAMALKHLNSKGKFLVVGHHEKPESIWDNPQLYPRMFPWLFPYGLGGIGTTNLSDKEHKRHLLMYHDKRFQTDHNFPFVAFSHEQVKASTSQSFLLAEKNKFKNITDRLLSLDQAVLECLIQKLSQGEYAAPETEEEKSCFQVINDLDHIAGNVKGSTTSKKYMRNEIWSLVTHCGAPSWYITLSPADTKHPICLYYAGSKTKFEPTFEKEGDRIRKVCSNPVASARFFHFLVEVFVDVVLGVKSNYRGLYGDTQAYYGTVEQQGRLSLHLHLLLWIKGGLRPQEIRDKIMEPESDFQKRIITWLESCVAGEYFYGPQQKVISLVKEDEKNPDYVNPTESMPVPPPNKCNVHQESSLSCERCSEITGWWSYFRTTIDDLLTKSNVHSCTRNRNKDGEKNKKHVYVGCMDNKWGKCKARFPRPIVNETAINKDTGSINLKKKESWLNTFTPIITYLFRCNTDVTCLLSGTAIKAVILYVSDYITKAPLKTHVIFEAIRSIFTKNTELIIGTLPSREKARRLMSKIVNLLAAKLEMGSPMISMYLLQNPDHYTGHEFVPFFWKSFVTEARKSWHETEESFEPDKVALINHKGKIIGLSPVFDYIYRSPELEDMNLYDWIRRCKRRKMTNKKSQKKRCEENGGKMEGNRIGSIKSKSKYLKYNFTDPHPLHDSHYTQVTADNEKIVANFIGGPLPRVDQGDREYYCSTMLAFFKPWRSGHDLKSADENWNTAFIKHSFLQRQEEIIKNMNIRYECLDSRDDYRAQLKKDAGALPHWIDDQGEDDASSLVDPYLGPSHYSNDDELPSQFLHVGKAEKRRQREILTMRNIMTNIGWTKVKYDKGLYPDDVINPIPITRELTGTEWKAEVSKKRQEVIEAQRSHIPDGKASIISSSSTTINTTNVVKIADKSYLVKKSHNPKHYTAIDQIVKQFYLNEEQERAFKIVANHASDSYVEPLRMYLGGMAGTGKSQVLKSLIEYFKNRNESFRLMIVAPTGNAAALLGGSTYHYSLGINDYNEKNASNLSQVQARLIGVDYIFLDEVSMLSCHDMYRISRQLALALNKAEEPFGGLSMLFAGDFAQLPPVVGGENSSLYSRTIGSIASHQRSQEEAMGKALWHQVTNIVILRKNMRQKNQSDDDRKFRTALENMRYKACTAADIAFLQTKISSSIPGQPSVSELKFHNVPIITALNVHKDEINRLGSERFAAETGQKLTHFYSDDFLKQSSGKKKSLGLKLKHISDELQNLLWEQPPSTTDKHIPGKLSLCRGMPVMIRHNIATELCMTRGQEATVYGWQSSLGSRGQLILDTLFVKLTNPPSNVKFEGLPENVVPLYRSTSFICCSLPDDTKVYIQRSQIEVLPNFAMTDFASQGKTRPDNPVDLNNCRTHQSCYTVLSRSATAAGTLIIQGFHPQKITGGASGALRQEFRELELLNEITRLRYEGKLKESVVGDQRNMLIAAFRKWKGLHYVPQSVHHAIRWNTRDPLLEPDIDDIKWKIIEKQKKNKSETTSNYSKSEPVPVVEPVYEIEVKPVLLKNLKRKGSNIEPTTPKKHKKNQLSGSSSEDHIIQLANPVGIKWSNNSCAYDSLFSILYTLWNCNPIYWKYVFCCINDAFFLSICNGFQQHQNGVVTLEDVRDDFRHLVDDLQIPGLYWGAYTAVSCIAKLLFESSQDIISSYLICKHQHVVRRNQLFHVSSSSCILYAGQTEYISITDWIKNFTEGSHHRCDVCNGFLTRQFYFVNVPEILIFDFERQKLKIDKEIHIVKGGKSMRFSLTGVTYYGAQHFTSRVVVNNQVWFHDGMTTGMNMMYEGVFNETSDLYFCGDRVAHMAIYAHDSGNVE
jgi:hypothetical protein